MPEKRILAAAVAAALVAVSTGALAAPAKKAPKLEGSYEIAGTFVKSTFGETPPGSRLARQWYIVRRTASCPVYVVSTSPSGEDAVFCLHPVDTDGSRYTGLRDDVKGDLKCKKGKGPWVNVHDGWKGAAHYEVVVLKSALVKHVLRVTRIKGEFVVNGVVQPNAKKAGCPGYQLVAVATFTGELADIP